jgi:integrase
VINQLVGNGRVVPKVGYVIDHGQEVCYPKGRFMLRSYDHMGRTVYKAVDSAVPEVARVQQQSAQATAVKVSKARDVRMYLKDAAAAYIADCKARGAMEAMQDARQVLSEFLPLCKAIAYTRSITRQDILAYHTYLKAKGNSARTVHNKHCRLVSFLRFAKGDLSVVPPKPKYESKLPTNYTSEELTSILAAADGHMRLVLLMGLKMGLRELEIAHAEWTDVNWAECTFRVQGKARWNWKVKDSEARDVPCPSDLMAAFKAWRQSHPLTRLIVGTAGDRPDWHLLRTLKRLATRSGLNCGQCRTCKRETRYQECEQWTLHKLRRTYATTLLRAGIDVRTVQAWCGWSDLDTALRYLRPSAAKDNQDRVNAVEW